MLRFGLLHPDILEALARAGHGSRVLIADGNYPFATTLGDNAALVHLNLAPGLVTCTQVLEALLTAVVVESASVMTPEKGASEKEGDPPIWNEFRRILEKSGYPGGLERIERHQFYKTAGSGDVALTIATGETRIYANLLLTIGVVPPS